MAAIGSISTVQRVTRVPIGTARAHDGRVYRSLSGVALPHHFIGESGTRQAIKGCHCRCSDVRDFAHRSFSFDKIRSTVDHVSRRTINPPPPPTRSTVDQTTSRPSGTAQSTAATNPARWRLETGRSLEKCLADARNDPISPSYAHGIVEGKRTPNALSNTEGKCLRGSKFRTRSQRRDWRPRSRRV